MTNVTHLQLRQAEKLVAQIRPILAGKSPSVIAATLGQLVSIFLASHAPPIREQQWELIKGLIIQLTSNFANEMIAAGRVPEGWDEVPPNEN
jgi:hypothetical protein